MSECLHEKSDVDWSNKPEEGLREDGQIRWWGICKCGAEVYEYWVVSDGDYGEEG